MSFGLGFGFPGTVAAGSGATLALQFAGATALDPRITFTRASSATFTNSAGLVASAATNAPRFDYDPVTRQPKGLLIEEARTNLLTYSEQFDNAAWTKTNSTITANAIVSPDGTTTADKVEETATTGQHLVTQSVTVVTASSYSMSVYAKAAERPIIRITDTSSLSSINADLSLGTIVSSSLVTNPQIAAVGNGWYRITGSFTSSGTTAVLTAYPLVGGTSSYLGVVGSGFYIWGAQLEAGAFATSYIPTVAAQATRAAENAVMTGTNFSSWYNQTEGTLCAQSQSVIALNVPSGVASGAACISDGTVSNRVDLRLQSGGSSFVSFVSTAGVTQATLINSGTYAPNSLYKMAVAYKVNDFARVTNAGAVEIDTSGSVPNVIDQLAIGFLNTVNTQTNGTIRSITYWPRRLSNAELQAVTS